MNTQTTNFVNLPGKECLKVFPIVKANADRHFKVSQLLASEKEYSNAIAHLILGTEELIKALALFLEAKGFNFSTITDYKKIFYNHAARHGILKEFFSIWIFCKSLVALKKKRRGENSIKYVLGIAADILGTGVEALDHYDWWKDADKLKQNGFYVDYHNGVITPESITEADYEKALYIVTVFRKDVRLFISFCSLANNTQLKQLKENLETAEIKGLIAESIHRATSKK